MDAVYHKQKRNKVARVVDNALLWNVVQALLWDKGTWYSLDTLVFFGFAPSTTYRSAGHTRIVSMYTMASAGK